jgi:hypothetical protein
MFGMVIQRLRTVNHRDWGLAAVLVAMALGGAMTWTLSNVPHDYLVIFVILLGGGVYTLTAALSSARRNSKRDEPDWHRRNNTRNLDIAPLVDALVNESRANRAERYPIELFTLLAVGVSAGFVISQWYEMRKVYDPIKDQADTLEKTRIVSQRPYAYAEPIALFHVQGVGVLQAYTSIGNSGSTFAIDAQRFIRIEVSDKHESITRTIRPDRVTGTVVLNPGGKQILVTNWSGGRLTAVQFEKVRSGTLFVYVFGKIIYKDIFGGKHGTDFCYIHYGPEGRDYPASGPNGEKTSFGYEGWQAKYCEYGNRVYDE